MASIGRCENCRQAFATRISWDTEQLLCMMCPPHDNCSSYGYGRVLVRRSAWEEYPEDYRRRGRTQAHETQQGSAIAAARSPYEGPAVLTLDPMTGGTILVPVIIVDHARRG